MTDAGLMRAALMLGFIIWLASPSSANSDLREIRKSIDALTDAVKRLGKP